MIYSNLNFISLQELNFYMGRHQRLSIRARSRGDAGNERLDAQFGQQGRGYSESEDREQGF